MCIRKESQLVSLLGLGAEMLPGYWSARSVVYGSG